ncbi:hypothetical protein [Falsiroseomonas sp.]|uniref:hypothetical protein n=1 Tax=Falsiroseomonas sp. TaxID=2870721 RepID=UPI003F70F2E9
MMEHSSLKQALKGYLFRGGKPPLSPSLGEAPCVDRVPFKGATQYQANLYWWWWHCLRQVDGYLDTCAQQGQGEYSLLYAHMGDVRGTSFHDWFLQRGTQLFAEPRERRVRRLHAGEEAPPEQEALCVVLPLTSNLTSALQQVRRLLEPRLKDARTREFWERSHTQFPLASKTAIHTIRLALMARQLRQRDPKVTLLEMAEKLGIKVGATFVDPKNKLTSEAADYLRMGNTLVKWVACSDQEHHATGRVLSAFPVVNEPA